MRRGAFLGALLLAASAATAAWAVTPRTWLTVGTEGWLGTERDSAGVTSEGSVALARSATPVDGIEGAVVWDLLADGREVWVATGDRGAVYRVDARGKVAKEIQVLQPEVTALGKDSKGTILLGASPDGVLYRVDGDRAVQAADTPETYIWKILPHPQGGALVATGNAGKIYRLSGSGEITLVADLEAANATGLEPRGENFLITTDLPGRLLELTPSGDLRVLYDAEEPELRSPVLGKDGTIFFAANPEGGPGRVLRRTAAGSIEPVWTAPAGYVYELALRQDGTLWASAGSDSGPGSVVEIDPGSPSRWIERVRVDEPQVLATALGNPGEEWIGTGGQGRLYRLGKENAVAGVVTSRVEDAGGGARWGALSVQPVPRGATLETRSGDTRIPDRHWSAWKTLALDPDRGSIPSPPGRFLQWRLTLRDPAARVSRVEVTLLPANRAPRIARAQVSELGASLGKIWDRAQPTSLSQSLPGGVRVEFQPSSPRSPEGEAPDEEAIWARRYRGVTWDTDDPNGDPLKVDLYLREMQEKSWKPLVKDLEGSPWIWDSGTVPDGWYVLEVRASDRGANPPGEALEVARETDPFSVDNTPPRVRELRVSGGRLTGIAEDDVSAVKKIEMAVDGKPWVAVFPEDGIPDMPRESFSVPLETLEKGEHVIVVRVFDRAGNSGTGRTSFTS